MEDASSRSRPDGTPQALLERALEHARHVLPAQGPIGSFVHHNTLHAYQHLPFHQAIAEARALHDGEGYLPEQHYRDALASGRIAEQDFERALALRADEVADEPIGPTSRRALEALLLRCGAMPDSIDLTFRPELGPQQLEHFQARLYRVLHDPTGAEFAPLAPYASREALAHTAARDLATAAAQALALVARALAPDDPPLYHDLLARFGRDRTARDLLVAIGARDPNELTNPVLIDLLGAYLDVGMARWSMPGRERGLLRCFVDQLRLLPSSLRPFEARVLARLERALAPLRESDPRAAAQAIVLSVLSELGVEPRHYAAYVSRTLLELPGFSGMVARLESVPSDREPDAPPASLLELLAIRLALDVEAYAECAREAGHDCAPRDLAEAVSRVRPPPGNETNARRLFDVCQLASISADELARLGAPFASAACKLAAEFDDTTRRRLLHEAYEYAHLREVLDALARHRLERAAEAPPSPRFQVLFCIDDREESIRRYFEELDPGHSTYGVAGFFGVAMNFLGIDDAAAAALCPVVVQPAHAVHEEPLPEHGETLVRRRKRRNLAARVRFELADSSRSLARGAALTPLLGLFSAVPLTFRVLFPHATERIHRWFAEHVLPAPRTQLVLHREGDPVRGSSAEGFTLAEQAERVLGTLENIGLVRDFAPLVAVLGHGATTANNPHHSAYDCGACGGHNGGPNARAFAAMANSAAVRELLRARGVDIPEDTWFLGGLHDTTTDEVTLFDLALVPERMSGALSALIEALDEARALSALERCRKFEHAPRDLSPEAALKHVEERAVDLSQARPELGHATNAVCIVGRRELSRSLFLDRRSFLVSYSAESDPQLSILERTLRAVVPVGAGINLEYYFSTVDNDLWGSGTKLPHNLACLLGVMEGASGDLRTGLPRQMIEVHDPVRLLSVVEAAPEAISAVVACNPELRELVVNGWVRVASVHPESGAISVYERGEFRPYSPSTTALPTISSALAWYRDKRGFLPPARIVPGGKDKTRAA